MVTITNTQADYLSAVVIDALTRGRGTASLTSSLASARHSDMLATFVTDNVAQATGGITNDTVLGILRVLSRRAAIAGGAPIHPPPPRYQLDTPAPPAATDIPTLITTLAGIVSRPRFINSVSSSDLITIRDAIMLPDELARLRTLAETHELYCANCSVRFYDHELVVTAGGRTPTHLYCTRCVRADHIRCAEPECENSCDRLPHTLCGPHKAEKKASRRGKSASPQVNPTMVIPEGALDINHREEMRRQLLNDALPRAIPMTTYDNLERGAVPTWRRRGEGE